MPDYDGTEYNLQHGTALISGDVIFNDEEATWYCTAWPSLSWCPAPAQELLNNAPGQAPVQTISDQHHHPLELDGATPLPQQP
eukprot:scaffold120606_cov18-Tisochrysis_lutea.AAC.1